MELKGNLIGNPGIRDFSISNIGDGDRISYFSKDETGPSYIAIDLGKGNTSDVSSISFLPRNDDNAVVDGLKYMLSYWGDNKLISLGEDNT